MTPTTRNMDIAQVVPLSVDDVAAMNARKRLMARANTRPRKRRGRVVKYSTRRGPRRVKGRAFYKRKYTPYRRRYRRRRYY